MATLLFPCNYLFKINNENTRTWCKICPKLTLKTLERRQWRRSGLFIVNFEHISHHVLVYLLLTWSKRGYFFLANWALRVVNVRRSILFNIARNWNQTTFKSGMAGASAFDWFLVILPCVGWFWVILWFILFIWFMFSNYIRTI